MIPNMTAPTPRPLALCVFRHEDMIFISKGYDPVKKEYFYRPVGGGIEDTETPTEALIREIKEELNAEIKNIRLLATFENIFIFNGRHGHELITLFEADFSDPLFYQNREHQIIENGKLVSTADWQPLESFLRHEAIMYPIGLLDTLKKHWMIN